MSFDCTEWEFGVRRSSPLKNDATMIGPGCAVQSPPRRDTTLLKRSCVWISAKERLVL